MTNHSRIISVNEVVYGGNTKRANKRYGWNVIYFSGPTQQHEMVTTRTTRADGTPLKKPVREVKIAYVPGVASRIVRRRSTLKKMGVRL
jgi:hypothetical protein